MSRIELKKDALSSNIAAISKIAPIEKIYAVLKDNAYGHGLALFGSMCAASGIQHAIVRDKNEAVVLCDKFQTILCLAEQREFDAPLNVHFAVNTFSILNTIPLGTKIHLKIDTGMHRCGIAEDELLPALELICSRGLLLCGVFSHLRSADELSSESFWQEKNFLQIKKTVVDFCEAKGLKQPLFHLQNSAGLFRSGGLGEFDMARVGIALYGYLDMPQAVCSVPLSPVMSLWADKIASRALKKGQAVGYGAVGKMLEDAIVSTYDIGYADGFLRIKTEKEYTLPNGSRLIGRVSMDNICVESSDDTICVFDDASIVADRYGTISYEILTRLTPAIPRIIV